jgi:hypothetical protein
MGITPLYLPKFSVDRTGLNERLVLVGHDGAISTLYTDPSRFSTTSPNSNEYLVDNFGVPVPIGLMGADVMGNNLPTLMRYFDIRDLAMYFYEMSVYNAASDKLKNDYEITLTLSDVVQSAYRETRFSNDEISRVMIPSLSRWASLYRLDPKINMGARNYSKNRLRVWNGISWVESQNEYMPGSERAILKFYFEIGRAHV